MEKIVGQNNAKDLSGLDEGWAAAYRRQFADDEARLQNLRDQANKR